MRSKTRPSLRGLLLVKHSYRESREDQQTTQRIPWVVCYD